MKLFSSLDMCDEIVPFESFSDNIDDSVWFFQNFKVSLTQYLDNTTKYSNLFYPYKWPREKKFTTIFDYLNYNHSIL